MKKPLAIVASAAALAGVGVGVNALIPGHACGCNTPTFAAPPDTTAPSVSITAPAGGATLSGASSTLTATAADNVAVVGVQFKIDGANIGGEDLVAPYTFNWNTTVYGDGSHALTAVARDAAGNTTTSSTVTVTITNGGATALAYHEFVSSAGSTGCTRTSTAMTYAAALAASHVCNDFSHAYAIATSGDSVGVEPGSYGDQKIAYVAKTLNGGCNLYPASADTTGCVTFEPDGGGVPLGAAVTVNGLVTSAGPNVRIRNMLVTGGIGFGWTNVPGSRVCSASVPQPHDFVIDGVEFAGASSSFSVSSVYDVSLVNSRFDGNQDIAGGSNIAAYTLNQLNSDCNTTSWPGLTQTQLNPDKVYVNNNVWNGLVQTTLGPPTPHLQELHVRMANDFVISGNQFLNSALFGLNIESQGTSSPIRNLDNGSVTGNVFDAVCSNQTPSTSGGTCLPGVGLAIICHTTGDTITNLTVAYNTFHNDGNIWQQASGGGSPCNPGSSSTFAGDAFFGNASDGASQCVTGRGLTYQFNTWASGSTCDATEQIAATGYTAPSPTTYDFTPGGGSALIGFVTSPVTIGGVVITCPIVDAYQYLRPVAGQTKCAGGAVESGGTGPGTGPGPGTGGGGGGGGGSGGGGTGTGGSGLVSNLSTIQTITEGGVVRNYKTYKPTGLSCASGGCPLLVLMPGSPGTCNTKTTYDAMTDCDLGTNMNASGSNSGQIGQSLWGAQADAHNFIIVAPELSSSTCVNGGACAAEPSPQSTFINDLINKIETSGSAGANINDGKVYLTGFSGGASATIAVYCQENAQAGAKFVTTTDYSAIPTGGTQPLINRFAGVSPWSGALGGTAPAEVAVNTCNLPPIAKPTLFVTSKGDAQISTDDARPTGAFSPCAAKTAGTTCFLRASTINGYYANKYGCTGPAHTVLANSTYTSDDKNAYTCSAPASYEWLSLGSTTALAPNHTYAEFSAAAPTGYASLPAYVWHFWTGQ